MKNGKQQPNPRFLYRPLGTGPDARILRHLIVKEGPKRIVIQYAFYDGLSEETRRSHPLVYLNRSTLEPVGRAMRSFRPISSDGSSRPHGRLFATEEEARIAVKTWDRTVLKAEAASV